MPGLRNLDLDLIAAVASNPTLAGGVLFVGVVWFVAADVCRVLGIKNPRDAVADLDEDEKCVASTDAFSGGGYGHNLISESGLYALILRSRKPAAQKFRPRTGAIAQ